MHNDRNNYSSSRLLTAESSHFGSFSWQEGNWHSFEIHSPGNPSLADESYIVPLLPIEFHCHGIGDFDFSQFEVSSISAIENHLQQIGCYCVLTGFLPRSKVPLFVEFCRELARRRNSGEVTHILGVALEGPLLASQGGTAEDGNWVPTRREWLAMTEAPEVLEYIVLSADALLPGSPLIEETSDDHPSMDWIIDLLAEKRIAPSLGHFLPNMPEASARQIAHVIERYHQRQQTRPRMVLTDHLFNDMPRNFKHAWRSAQERECRVDEIEALKIDQWSLENLIKTLGAVPAVLARYTMQGVVAPSLNFDGDHVDHAICRQIVDMLGSSRIIAMTDLVADSQMLCGHKLLHNVENTLLYQREGMVAAGSQGILRQIRNLRLMNLAEQDIWNLVAFTPAKVLKANISRPFTEAPERFVYVDYRGNFGPFSHVSGPSCPSKTQAGVR